MKPFKFEKNLTLSKMADHLSSNYPLNFGVYIISDDDSYNKRFANSFIHYFLEFIESQYTKYSI